MIVALFDDLLAAVLITALILSILHYGWFKKYLFVIGHLVISFAGLVYGLILLVPKIVVGLLKAMFVVVLFAAMTLVYLSTYLLPKLGGRVGSWQRTVKYNIPVSYFALQAHKMRDIMVGILAEVDDRDRQFDKPEEYRSRLSQVKNDGKKRLERGETILSILVGTILLISKIQGWKLLQATLFTIPVDFLIESWLLVIAVSIIYRSSALEFLTYDSNADFDSPAVMDAALAYQKAISLVGYIQMLTFVLIFSSSLIGVKHDLIEEALKAKYNGDPWIFFTWKKLTE